MQVEIIRLTDSHDCETCGSSWAEGARVLVDGQLAFELVPSAHFFDESNYQDDEIYKRLIEYLGHDVTWIGA